ncbi:PASTA domain-containing protein [Rhodococcus zopfii]|uniref:PASTA domain-containing protein n=1 Tax=Rhodococcus zopfii TaxID=43772 RepID=A0ABU3WMH8_9NOCA|nr:PASTA domain-containing protein [Rhodococcus zopfii]MDV2475202.1 PASTA domain-containing protein [Rhodococcus zopfii]
MHRTLTVAAVAATAALTFGPGVAAGDPTGYPDAGVPNVVGMSEQEAVTTLENAGIPYTITNKSGSALTVCNVTNQRDKGYITKTRAEWDSTDQEWDYIRYEVWQGIGLTVVCN